MLSFITVMHLSIGVTRSLKESIAGGAAIIFTGNIINMLSSILTVKLLVRGLGSSGYGLYSRIISPILFVQPLILLFGERYYAFKYIPSYIARGRLKEASNLTMFLLLLRIFYGSLLTLTVYLSREMLAEYIGYPDLAGLVGIASLIIFLNGMYELGYSLSLSGGWEKYTVVGSIATNIFKVSMLFLFLFLSNLEIYQALISLIVGYIAGDSIMFILTMFKLKPKLVKPMLYMDYFREMVSYGLPVVFQVLSVGLCLEFPPMLFAHAGSNLENAVLRVSNRYFKMVRLVGSSLTLSMIPKISSRESEEDRINVVSSSIPYFAYVGSLLSALVMGFPRILLSIMSVAYIDYWAVLAVIGLSNVFLSFIPLRVLLVVNSGKKMAIIGLIQLLYTLLFSYITHWNLLLLSFVYPSFYGLYLLLVAEPFKEHVKVKYIFKYTAIGILSSIISMLVGQIMDNIVMKVQLYLPFYSLIAVVLPLLMAVVFIIHANIYVCLGGLTPEKIVGMYSAVDIPSKLKAKIIKLLKLVILGKTTSNSGKPQLEGDRRVRP